MTIIKNFIQIERHDTPNELPWLFLLEIFYQKFYWKNYYLFTSINLIYILIIVDNTILIKKYYFDIFKIKIN